MSTSVWDRPPPGSRRPRFSRDEIAAAALRIADAEGLAAVSMRRVAEVLGAGTMTLYHYVAAKDELLMLLDDLVVAENLVPEDEFPTGWREALTAIARRSRDAAIRHPWLYESRPPGTFGPNAIRHVDQSLRAVSGLGLSLGQQFEIVTMVDEYVAGYCMLRRQVEQFAALEPDDVPRVFALAGRLAEEEGLTTLTSALYGSEDPTAMWQAAGELFTDGTRFDRNLARVLDGLAASLSLP
jgi:AcrR family transcriptional regulator